MATGDAHHGRIIAPITYGLRWLILALFAATLLQVLAVANPSGHGFVNQVEDRIRSGSTSTVLTDQATANQVRVLWQTGALSWTEACTSQPP
jgi:hypothetical protein